MIQLSKYSEENSGDQDWAKNLISLIDKELIALKDDQDLWPSKMLKRWAHQNGYNRPEDNPTFARLKHLFVVGNSAMRFTAFGLCDGGKW